MAQACQLFRENGKVDKVLAPNQKPSILYKAILDEVKKVGVKPFIDGIPYLQDRIKDGTLLNDSEEEIAVGLWSITYSPEYQKFFTNISKNLTTLKDANGEPTFSLFKTSVLEDRTTYIRVSPGSVLDPEKKEFVNGASKRGNELQQKIAEFLTEKLENPVVLEPEDHVYYDQEGDAYISTTTKIKGKLEDDAYEANRAIGTSVDKLLQGIVLGKNFEQASEGLTNIDESSLRHLFSYLQLYVDNLTKDGSIILTQLAFGDKFSKTAGSLDLLVISPYGKIKIVDLKVSKNSVKTDAYDVKYDVKDGSVFLGEKLSTRQQHGIQVGVYKKLVELLGFDVDSVATVHINVRLDENKKVKDALWEGEMNHPVSINKDYVDKVVPTKVENTGKADQLRKELGIDNPADDPNYLTEEEAKPEREIYGDDAIAKMSLEVKKVINLFDERKKYLEKLREGKTFYDKDLLIEKITGIMALMSTELRDDMPSRAYGNFLRYAKEEVADYLNQITDPKNFKTANYISLLLEVDKYIESYRGIISVKGAGSQEQKLMFNELLDLLDDTRQAVDDNLELYVRELVKSKTSRDLTEQELSDIMKNVYDIPLEDYAFGDMATSKDTLLAIADKIYKAAQNKAKDNSDKATSRIFDLGKKLLKAAGISKPEKDFYDFMKVFKDGKFTGRYVSRIGQKYYDLYYKFKNAVREKNGDSKQYIPILDVTKAKPEDLKYNIQLFYDKQAYREFMNAETYTSLGAEDGAYHKYTDEFKKIRNRYEELVSYTKEDGTVFYRWERRANVPHEEYEKYKLKYFNENEYWGAEFEADGSFQGRVTLKKGRFVKSEYIEIRDVAADGTKLTDPKYDKLMNPKTELEKAQSEFYKAWVDEYQSALQKYPPDVAAQMKGKVGRVGAAYMEKLKARGEGFTSAVAKGLRNFFKSDFYTNQRLVNELGEIDNGIPILYVGKLKNEGRIEYLKKELSDLKFKRTQGKVSKKEYLEQRNKLNEYIRVEEGKLSASEIEGDLVMNLVSFVTAAENYEVMSNVESDLKAIAQTMENRDYYEVDSLGNRLIRKGSRMTKDDQGKPVIKRKEDVLATKRLKKWFTMVFYNNQEMNRSTTAMVAMRLQNLTSLKGVGFNVFGNINNYVMGRINTSIETAGSLYYDRPAANRAVKEYNSDYLPSMFKKLGRFSADVSGNKEFYTEDKPFSKYEALVSKFRMIKKYQADSGKVDFMSWAYMLQEGGEYNVQSKSGMAILMSKQITNKKTGETLSIYDAYDFNPNTGELYLKDGFELTDEERYNITNYILEVNKQIHGNYAYEDRMVIQNHWVGQLAAQFHKWIYPAYKTRFKKRYVDENLGDVEGRYISVMNLVAYIREAEGTFLQKLQTGWKNMDEIQIKNMYKNLAELAFFAASFAMYGVFKGLASGLDDDDENLKRWLNFLQFQQTRQMTEISTMIPIVGFEEQWQIAKSPIPVLTTLKDFGQALKSTMTLPLPPYDKNYYERGPFKDDLKAWKEWKDVIPALGILNKWESFDQVKSFYIK